MLVDRFFRQFDEMAWQKGGKRRGGGEGGGEGERGEKWIKLEDSSQNLERPLGLVIEKGKNVICPRCFGSL